MDGNLRLTLLKRTRIRWPKRPRCPRWGRVPWWPRCPSGSGDNAGCVCAGRVQVAEQQRPVGSGQCTRTIITTHLPRGQPPRTTPPTPAHSGVAINISSEALPISPSSENHSGDTGISREFHEESLNSKLSVGEILWPLAE